MDKPWRFVRVHEQTAICLLMNLFCLIENPQACRRRCVSAVWQRPGLNPGLRAQHGAATAVLAMLELAATGR